ncbi:MAG TPA: hypothetical protein VER33_28600 [Polyangiaceae bacterium]|nr:hypothetical protein [Polyangiaceae bacterium]
MSTVRRLTLRISFVCVLSFGGCSLVGPSDADFLGDSAEGGGVSPASGAGGRAAAGGVGAGGWAAAGGLAIEPPSTGGVGDAGMAGEGRGGSPATGGSGPVAVDPGGAAGAENEPGAAGGESGAAGAPDCNGTSADLQTDANNCGRCGSVCALPNAEAACVAGVCTVARGRAGFGDCNATAGCESALTTATHCGACGQSCAAPSVCGGVGCDHPAATLDGQRLELPCDAVSESANVCWDYPTGTATCPSTATAPYLPVNRRIVFGGPPGMIYDVTLHIHGVVETKIYQGGQDRGDYFYVGGAPSASTFNSYSLSVSAPAAVYYFNAGPGEIYSVVLLNHHKTIRVQAGATLQLTAQDRDCRMIRNCRDTAASTCAPLVPPGIVPAPAPFNGQYLQLDVTSVTPVATP